MATEPWSHGEHKHADDMVFAEHIGLALSGTADSPVFGVVLGTPGGGTVIRQMDATQMIAFAGDMCEMVSRVMSGLEYNGTSRDAEA